MGPRFNSPRLALLPLTIFPSRGRGTNTEKANNKPGLVEAAAAGGSAAAALLAVFRIPFTRPRVSPLPWRLSVSPLLCLDKVSPLFRERVSPLFRERVSVFRLKVSPFRLKVPSLRGPVLSSFLLPMLLVRDGSSILTDSDPLVLVWLVHSHSIGYQKFLCKLSQPLNFEVSVPKVHLFKFVIKV